MDGSFGYRDREKRLFTPHTGFCFFLTLGVGGFVFRGVLVNFWSSWRRQIDTLSDTRRCISYHILFYHNSGCRGDGGGFFQIIFHNSTISYGKYYYGVISIQSLCSVAFWLIAPPPPSPPLPGAACAATSGDVPSTNRSRRTSSRRLSRYAGKNYAVPLFCSVFLRRVSEEARHSVLFYLLCYLIVFPCRRRHIILP